MEGTYMAAFCLPHPNTVPTASSEEVLVTLSFPDLVSNPAKCPKLLIDTKATEDYDDTGCLNFEKRVAPVYMSFAIPQQYQSTVKFHASALISNNKKDARKKVNGYGAGNIGSHQFFHASTSDYIVTSYYQNDPDLGDEDGDNVTWYGLRYQINGVDYYIDPGVKNTGYGMVGSVVQFFKNLLHGLVDLLGMFDVKKSPIVGGAAVDPFGTKCSP
jgi:hypothetical protein